MTVVLNDWLQALPMDIVSFATKQKWMSMLCETTVLLELFGAGLLLGIVLFVRSSPLLERESFWRINIYGSIWKEVVDLIKLSRISFLWKIWCQAMFNEATDQVHVGEN